MRSLNKYWILVGTAAVAAIAAGTSFATAVVSNPDTSVIQACQNTTNGLVRIVTENTTDCRVGEKAISWNQVGPQGPPGEPGPPGPAGSGGGSLAFAHVHADGTIDAARSSQNVSAVTKALVPGSVFPGVPDTGFTLYCFDLATTAAKNISVTVENTLVVLNQSPFPGVTVSMRNPNVNATVDPSVAARFGCAGGTDAAVVIATGTSGAPFYALFN